MLDKKQSQYKHPNRKPVTISDIFKNTQKPDYRKLADSLRDEYLIDKQLVLKIVKMYTQITKNEPNILHLSDPLTIVGDIHGQYYDLLKIFQLVGEPSTEKYLFLGDYVDRGCFSVEVVLLLTAMKICHPTNVYMIRGNHECRQLTSFFNFRLECITKFDQEVYECFMDMFDSLPLAAVVNRKYFAVHGGLSPELKYVKEDIGRIKRFKEPAKTGLFCDLLWSDPLAMENKEDNPNFSPNHARGCSFYFGPLCTKSFLQKNGLVSVIRAHEAQHRGFKLHRWGASSEPPSVITVFSAPNYCDNYGNQGAILRINNNSTNFLQFDQSPHPFVLPNFMNLFSWSMPFIGEKVSELFLFLLKYKYSNAEERKGINKQLDAEIKIALMAQEELELIKALMSHQASKNKQSIKKVEANRRQSLDIRSNEQLFQELRKNDKFQRHPEPDFGPKIFLNPLKIQHQEEDHDPE